MAGAQAGTVGSRAGYLGDQGDIHGRSCSWCGAMANGSCQFALHPVSVAGRAGRVSQTRVRPWLAMGRQRSRRRHEGSWSPRWSSHRLSYSSTYLNVPGFTCQLLHEVFPQIIPHIPQYPTADRPTDHFCTFFVRGGPRHARGRTILLLSPSQTCADSLPLRQ